MLLRARLSCLLRAAAREHNTEIDIFVKDISVNGEKKGCSGHVVNKDTGSCIYLTTEESVYGPLKGKSMYRLAKDTKDWSSNGLKNGNNRWCNTMELAKAAIKLLVTERPIEK